MHCKVCEYQLWNLHERRCPECGSPFTPSEYDFVVNSVQFRCPHCEQVYYGTGERGHLEPPEFTCVSCAQLIRMDDMVLRPAPGIEDQDTQADHVPWLERAQRGRFKAWLSTVGMALVGQTRLMRAHRHVNSGGQAWWFAIVTVGFWLAIAVMPFAILMMILPIVMGGGGPVAAGLVGFAVFAIVALIVLPVWIGLWGLVTQGILRLADRPAGTIGRTYEAICYSSGALVSSAVPLCGFYLAWIGSIWWMVSAVLMVKERQQVRGGSAALAVLTLPCVTALVCGGLIGYGISQARQFTATIAVPAPTSAVQLIVDGILEYTGVNEGSGPGHAVELVGGGYVDSVDLVSTSSMTDETDVPVADTTLEQYAEWPRERQRQAEQAATSALPAGTVAHRLGDFVFTYHGIDLRNADARLWIVIESWDPDIQAGEGAVINQITIAVGFADGTVSEFGRDQLAAKLIEQNALRATLGLAPLPQPETVRHGQPAVVAPTTRPLKSNNQIIK